MEGGHSDAMFIDGNTESSSKGKVTRIASSYYKHLGKLLVTSMFYVCSVQGLICGFSSFAGNFA